MHGHIGSIGIAFWGLHIVAAGAFLYFMYSISVSLKRIASR